MVMSWIFTGMLTISFFCGILRGTSQALAASLLQGAQAGVELAMAMAGSICLWSGVGKLLDSDGITDLLSAMLRPGLRK
jgi:spore maturation protein A